MPAPTKSSFNFTPSFLFDALIIGAGPAGLSAALTLCRQARPAAVFSTSTFRNDRAHRAHTVLSRDHQPPSEIRRVGREQIEAYGTTHFVERAVRSAKRNDTAGAFEVVDSEGEVWRGKKVVLAMGTADVMPEIEGYRECWGESIFQCMFCDGLERSDRPAAMLGFEGEMSLHPLGFVVQIGCPEVTVLTNGKWEASDEAAEKAMRVVRAKGVGVDERKIVRLVHLPDAQGIEVVFEEGESIKVGFLQHTPPTYVVAPEIADGLDVEIVSDGRGGTMLKRNEPFGETNIKGVFTAGDVGVAMKQVTVAMVQGVGAGGGTCMQLGAEADAELIRKLDGARN